MWVQNVCLKAMQFSARGQQLNHLSERVESEIKHLTWDGRWALIRQPSRSGAGMNGEEGNRKGKWSFIWCWSSRQWQMILKREVKTTFKTARLPPLIVKAYGKQCWRVTTEAYVWYFVCVIVISFTLLEGFRIVCLDKSSKNVNLGLSSTYERTAACICNVHAQTHSRTRVHKLACVCCFRIKLGLQEFHTDGR